MYEGVEACMVGDGLRRLALVRVRGRVCMSVCYSCE